MAASSSDDGITPPQYPVFISFRGADLRRTSFFGFLMETMRSSKVNVFTDEDMVIGTCLDNLFNRIEESRVALVIFSKNYTESYWCLNELVKMNKLMKQGKLVVIPIFYKLDLADCKNLKGAFGSNFKKLAWTYPKMVPKWQKALKSVCSINGMQLDLFGNEIEFLERIVEEVNKALKYIFTEERVTIGGNTEILTDKTQPTRFGVEQRFEHLENKLEFDREEETRFIGIVGMPGIGKTTLAKMLYEKWENKFERSLFIPDVSKMENDCGLEGLRKKLLEELLKDIHPNIEYKNNKHAYWMDDLLKKNVLVVVDDVSSNRQIKYLFGTCDWIQKGSKIVITSSNESLLQDLVHYTYVVPRLNIEDSLKWFTNHAFASDEEGNFAKLSRYFLDYAKGNPLALKALGLELWGKDMAYWKQRIGTLTQSSNTMIQDVLRRRYDELTTEQKDVFLDIACFFKSENASYVRSVVDTCDEIKGLTNMFHVNISSDQVEMHNMLCTFAKELASQALAENISVHPRLWNYQDITRILKNKSVMKNVRGIFLDMSKVSEEMSFDTNIFRSMSNLLYLKIYYSTFLQGDRSDLKLETPKDLQLPLDKVRYLHWHKFSLDELPSDFSATEVVTLELPYSSIKQLWEGVKDTLKLKLVDLSYSHKLKNLSGLTNAKNLERLNLEGCKKLVNLPQEMKNMKSLIYLNMRGCERLESLPMMKLSSLKILILSDCWKLKKFEVISKNLEALYLDGTALKELPPTIGDLERLAILNLKCCKRLESLPERLGRQKALEELILSGCSKLENVPKNIKNMRYLRILLIDGTRIKEIPMIYSLQRLCLKNDAIIHLQGNISQLKHLKWLDLKNCENLIYLPMLPPNLELFDAHGCTRLENVADPLSLCTMTEQIHSSFYFTNCNNLEQEARDVISSYAQWKCHRLALECYDRGVVSGALFNICYPGFEVPLWFNHQAVGSILEPRLQVQPHWCNNRLFGIALCAVVSFHENQNLMDTFSVKCKLQFEKEDESRISLDFDIGGLTEPGRINSNHVFIGYASCSHLTKRLEDHFSGNSIPTNAFLEFYVTDACESEVVGCGISFVYAEPKKVLVEVNRYRISSEKGGGFVEYFSSYIIMAFLFIVIFTPQYYLRFINFCGPLLVFLLFFVALALIAEWKNRKPKEKEGSESPGMG